MLAVVLGTVAFAGLGLCLAGTLKALVTLAAANGLYLVLLLLSGMVIPLDELPGPAQAVARALPSGALAEAVRGTLTAGVAVPGPGLGRAGRLGGGRPRCSPPASSAGSDATGISRRPSHEAAGRPRAQPAGSARTDSTSSGPRSPEALQPSARAMILRSPGSQVAQGPRHDAAGRC